MKRCPTCDSPESRLHPAVQHEGEVEICKDPFHAGEPEEPPERGRIVVRITINGKHYVGEFERDDE